MGPRRSAILEVFSDRRYMEEVGEKLEYVDDLSIKGAGIL
jgi:hypothetical protein